MSILTIQNDLPEKAVDLNAWIKKNFMVFEGPPKAYLELGFPIHIGFPEEEQGTLTLHRLVYITLGFRGQEDACCKALAAHLYMTVTREDFLDAREPIFIRRWFDYQTDEVTKEAYLSGRLVFWYPAKNKQLIKSMSFKQEGAIANRPSFPDGFFDRA